MGGRYHRVDCHSSVFVGYSGKLASPVWPRGIGELSLASSVSSAWRFCSQVTVPLPSEWWMHADQGLPLITRSSGLDVSKTSVLNTHGGAYRRLLKLTAAVVAVSNDMRQ
jgi:hypothetical protein